MAAEAGCGSADRPRRSSRPPSPSGSWRQGPRRVRKCSSTASRRRRPRRGDTPTSERNSGWSPRDNPRSPRTSRSTFLRDLRQPGGDLPLPRGRLRHQPLRAGLPGGPDHDRRQLRRRAEHAARNGADLQHGDGLRRRSGAPRVRRPHGQRADRDPDRGPQQSRLRPDADLLDDHRRASPLPRKRDDRLGLPRRPDPQPRTLPRPGTPAPARLPRVPRRQLHRIAPSRSRGIVVRPYIDNPSICTGEPLRSTARPDDLPGPGPDSRSRPTIRRRPAAKARNSTRSSTSALTNHRADSPSGLDIQLKAHQFLGLRHPPSPALGRARHAARRPDDQPGRRRRADAPARTPRPISAPRSPADCPDNSKIGTFDDRHAGPRRPAGRARSTSANRSPATSTGSS